MMFCINYFGGTKRELYSFLIQTFNDVGDTGIPELQSFVQELTRVRKIQGSQRLLRIVGQYVSDLLGYLCDEGTEVSSFVFLVLDIINFMLTGTGTKFVS